MAMRTQFAAYPSAVVYSNPDGTKPIQQLICGDWLLADRSQESPKGLVPVHARGEDGWMRKGDMQADRLLEVVFVDVGQGDGCLLVTPEDKHILIDAGRNENMARYLGWRYGGFKSPWSFEAAVISHSDADHYGGFSDLISIPNIVIETVYHNGIVERAGKAPIGPKAKSGGHTYLTDLVTTQAEMDAFFSVPSRWQSKDYPRMLHNGQANGTFRSFQMLGSASGFLPGYGAGKALSIAVLGPVVEPDASGRPRLRWLEDEGKTKNGHSVIMRLQYGDVSIMLGGDLNTASQDLLLGHYTGLPSPGRSLLEQQTLVEAARATFQVDVAKACHHGSSDISTGFLEALNPVATVISSGDDEPYSHPRADALGAIGLYSRGVRPLIFSTELARSASETIRHPNVLHQQLKDLRAEIEAAPTGTAKERRKRESLIKEFNKVVDGIDRSIAVFGAIHLRTDGHRAIVAQKLERPSSKSKKWDVYCLETVANGLLQYVPGAA